MAILINFFDNVILQAISEEIVPKVSFFKDRYFPTGAGDIFKANEVLTEYRITGKNGFTVETLYLLFSLTNVRSIVTGAVQPKISQANLNNVSVVIPSKAELSTFNSIVQPIFSQIRNLRAESDRLTSTRDILLPRLMSGEIDVSAVHL